MRHVMDETAVNLKPTFDWPLLLKDSSVINLGLSALIFGSMVANPAIWANDYPPDIREAYGPRDRRSTIQAAILAVPFFGILIGGTILSTRRLRRRQGGRLGFGQAFYHVYGLWLAFWLFDLTVLDWLFFVTIRPSWVVLPGTEGMAGYGDYRFHLTAALPALPLMALPAAVVAFFMRSHD